MKRAAAICALAGLVLAGCVGGGYRTSASVGYGYGPDIYYDDFYGPFYDGYWGPNDSFYFSESAGRPFRRDDGRHFSHEARGGFHHVEGVHGNRPEGNQKRG